VEYASVQLLSTSSQEYFLVRPDRKYLNLCNFNATFDLVFPGSDNALVIQRIFNGWVGDCSADFSSLPPGEGRTPYGADLLKVYLRYANCDAWSLTHKTPPVILNCAKCPPLNVRNSMDLKANVPVTLTPSSFGVSGGIPPYSIKFDRDRLPKGMLHYKGSAGWTWTPTLDQNGERITIIVYDSCKSESPNKTRKVVDFTFRITDPTPPTLSGLSISPNTLPPTGGDVVFKVTASDNKAVTMVNAGVSRPGWTMAVPLKRVSGTEKSGVWQGTYTAPANTTSQDVSYTVSCGAYDSDGNKSYSYKGGPVFIVKGKPAGSTIPSKPKGSTIQ
jgi:hypothetical protein